MFDAYFSGIHGGSIMGFVTHTGKKEKTDRLKKLIQEENDAKTNDLETYKKFAKNIEIMKEKNLEYLKKNKAAGKTIYGFGAPVKGNTLLNYFNVDTKYLDFLVEKNKLRKGLFSPGMHIPVILEEDVEKQPDIYYVLAWNFKKEILENNEELIKQGVEFYFPVNPKVN